MQCLSGKIRMEYTKLSKRLENVADYVPFGARLADVGSDHAYLPLFLVESGRISYAVAGEVVQGPYQSALANVKEARQQEKIKVRLANGLAAIETEDAIDTITIAGMGGRLIADILQEGIEKLSSVQRLILQPNNREDELRLWLSQNGFQIVAETILTENQKFYEIIVVELGKKNLTEQELRFGPYLLTEKSTVFQEKWQREQIKLESALAQIPTTHLQERQLLEKKIKAIKEVCHVSK